MTDVAQAMDSGVGEDDASAALAALLVRVAVHDRTAFAELYRRTAPAVLGTLLRMLRRRAVAEDALQDVYERVWQRAGDFDAHRGRPMTWLLTLARYRAIDLMRRDRLELVEPERLAESLDALAQATGAAEGDAAGDADEAERRRLARCFAVLSEDQQRSVLLAFAEGRSHPEIAAALGRPLGSVKSWIRRALQSLKECLQSCSPTTP